MVLDLYDLCSDDLKAVLKEHRNILAARDEVRLQNRHGSAGKGKVSTAVQRGFLTVKLMTVASITLLSLIHI